MRASGDLLHSGLQLPRQLREGSRGKLLQGRLLWHCSEEGAPRWRERDMGDGAAAPRLPGLLADVQAPGQSGEEDGVAGGGLDVGCQCCGQRWVEVGGAWLEQQQQSCLDACCLRV